MEKIIGNDYRFRLNEKAHNYQEIIADIKSDVNKNKKIDETQKSGYWEGHITIQKNEIRVIMAADYEGAPVSLNPNTIAKIKENIKLDPEYTYAYTIDAGIHEGNIRDCQGIAFNLAQKIDDIGMHLYNTDGQETFKYYINNLNEMKQLDKYGESRRLQRKLLNKSANTVSTYEIVFNESLTKKENKFDELWVAYFLVNGTKNLIRTNMDLGPASLSLKEILYLEDKKKYRNNWGKEMLQRLTMFGVSFDEGTSDISGNLMVGGKIGDPVRTEDPELINQWFKKNKTKFNHYPTFSDATLNILKEEFPDTYNKLNIIINKEAPKKRKYTKHI